MELGFHRSSRWNSWFPSRIEHEDLSRIATALVITLSVGLFSPTAIGSVVFFALTLRVEPGNTTLGLP